MIQLVVFYRIAVVTNLAYFDGVIWSHEGSLALSCAAFRCCPQQSEREKTSITLQKWFSHMTSLLELSQGESQQENVCALTQHDHKWVILIHL